MVKLMLDVGNSAIKWATLTSSGLSSQQRLLYQRENFAPALEQIAQTIQDCLEAIWISSVVGDEIAALLTQWAQTQWRIHPTFANTIEKSTGITHGYKQPEQLGVDRWLALVAARRRVTTGQLCVVDCGTAVTLDIVSAENQHLGGLILPGVRLMQQSLMIKTVALKQPTNNIPLPTDSTILLAQDTATAITLGTVYAVVGWLEYTLLSWEKQKGYTHLILTGGNASMIQPLLSKPYQQIPDLVLQGLVVLATDS